MDMRRFRDLFLSESRDHLGSAYELLARIEAGAADRETLRSLLRHAHSLKGMAASMGYAGMVEIAHATEDLFDRFLDESGPDPAPHLELIGDGFACIGRMVDSMETDDDGVDPRTDEVIRELRLLVGGDAAAFPRRAPAAEAAPEAAPTVWSLRLELAGETACSAAATTRLIRALPRLGRVRSVRPPRLDSLVPGHAEPLRVEIEGPGPGGALERAAAGLAGVRRAEAAPRGSRATRGDGNSPSTRWVRVRAELLDDLLARAHDLMLEQRRTEVEQRSPQPAGRGRQPDRVALQIRALFRTVKALRLTPLDTMAHRLNQAARELSRSLGKPLAFRIVGGDVQLDRSLVDALLSPLLHLIRNAADHGLESAGERAAMGKSERGEILLEVNRSGDRVELAVRDDGRGIDPGTIRSAAVAAGQVSEQLAQRLTGARALSLLTLPGFSTATHVNAVSGRGVGLDAVRTDVEALGGRLYIDSVPGSGSSFRLVLPLTVALVPALMVRCGGDLFALPVQSVREARCLSADSLPLVRLDEHLGFAPSSSAAASGSQVLVLDDEARQLGVVVDEVLGTREILVKPLAGGPADDGLYSGAALLDDGGVALVVNPAAIRPASGASR